MASTIGLIKPIELFLTRVATESLSLRIAVMLHIFTAIVPDIAHTLHTAMR